MAHCAHLMQSQSPSAPPSPTPVIWAPLIQAPLQAAAATTSVAIALTHQSHLPPSIFRPPVSTMGSTNEASRKQFHAVPTSTTPGSAGDSPSSTSSKLHTGVDTPVLTSFRVLHSTGPPGSGSACRQSYDSNCTKSSQPGTERLFSRSASLTSSTAQLHPPPKHKQPFAPSTPPLSDHLFQDSSSFVGLSEVLAWEVGGAVGGAVGEAINEAVGGPSGATSGGAVVAPVRCSSSGLSSHGSPGGASFGGTGGIIAMTSSNSSHLSTGSLGHVPSQHFYTPTQKVTETSGKYHFSGGSDRTSSTLNLFHTPTTGSPSSTHLHITPTFEGSPSFNPQHTSPNLWASIPSQLPTERYALASLTQHGSANGSPCYTPLAPSPTVQSPMLGRTFHYPSSTTGSHSSLPMPQSPCPVQLPSRHPSGTEFPLGRFSEDLKLLSSSHPMLGKEVAQTLSQSSPRSLVDPGSHLSPYSSPTLMPKSCGSILGHIAPPAQTSPSSRHHTPILGTSPSLPFRRSSEACSSQLEPFCHKLPSNL